MVTRLYHHDVFLEHMTAPGHPERPDRLKAIAEALEGDEFGDLERVEAPEGDEAMLELAHSPAHVAAIRRAIPEEGLAQVDPDTWMSPRSWEAALRGVAASADAVDSVFTGKAHNAFVACRPPGHHAESRKAMGFCLFNNAAIAARHAQRAHGVERVAIIDWDVHHGNGTQEIFWDDASVLYCSTHQLPLYPGTGTVNETGAKGNIVNAPLSPGADGRVFREAMDNALLPRVEEFRPDLIIISAGFDAHYRDPLAELRLQEDDFSWATGKLMDIAGRWCDYRVVSLLEGGYDLQGLASSVSAHLRRLMKG
jgi:Deacetylases, including yeast histone deacetylase and acetoin utilization protein